MDSVDFAAGGQCHCLPGYAAREYGMRLVALTVSVMVLNDQLKLMILQIISSRFLGMIAIKPIMSCQNLLPLVGLSVLMVSSSLKAAVLADFDFTGSSAASVDASTDWSTTNLVAGGGLALNFDGSRGNAAPSAGTTYGVVGNGLASAIADNDFYSFIIAPDANRELTYTNIQFDLYKTVSASSTVSVNLLTSLDGFTSSVGVATLVGTAQSNGFFARSIDLGSLTDNLSSAVEFRLYIDDGGGSTVTNQILFDNIIVNGDVAVVPESSALLLGSLGALLLLHRRRG